MQSKEVEVMSTCYREYQRDRNERLRETLTGKEGCPSIRSKTVFVEEPQERYLLGKKKISLREVIGAFRGCIVKQ